MNYDKLIFQAVKNYSKAKPQTIVGILVYIDIEDKNTLSYEELREGLRRLIRQKRIAEAVHGKYFDTNGESYPEDFSDISKEEYQEALTHAHREIKSLVNELKSPENKINAFECHVLSIRWKIEKDAYATDQIENAVNDFAEKVNKGLSDKAIGEVNGLEFGPGLVDILVFGAGDDKSSEEIYSTTRDIYSSYPVPLGSAIVRYDKKNRGEIILDIKS
jgi:hypothetical protein